MWKMPTRIFDIFTCGVKRDLKKRERKQTVTGTSWPTRNRWKLNSSDEEKFLILVDFMTA